MYTIQLIHSPVTKYLIESISEKCLLKIKRFISFFTNWTLPKLNDLRVQPETYLTVKTLNSLTLSRGRSLSYRNQSIYL